IDRFVSHGHAVATALHPVLPDHVGHPNAGLHLHVLNCPECEIVGGALAVPAAVGGFRLGPAARYRQHEALSPAAAVVADMRHDLGTFGLRRGGIPLDEFDTRHGGTLSRYSDQIGFTHAARSRRELQPRQGPQCPGAPTDGVEAGTRARTPAFVSSPARGPAAPNRRNPAEEGDPRRIPDEEKIAAGGWAGLPSRPARRPRSRPPCNRRRRVWRSRISE